MSQPGIVGIVLAGGASSRFGSDKLAAELDGRPLLHHALEGLGALADPIVLVLAPDAPVPPLPDGVKQRVLVARDVTAFGGPLAGLSAGLRVVEGLEGHRGSPGLALVAGGDMPTLSPLVLRILADALAADASLVAMTLGAPGPRPAPLPMAIRPGLANQAITEILASGGRRSLLALLEAVPSGTVPEADWRSLDPDGATLRDVDTPDDLPRG
jgi:molybdopterin-guanine dinucleotide biosynthesis protein A